MNPTKRANLSGDALRKRRAETGLSWTVIGFLAEVDAQTVGRWERNVGGRPTYGKIERLAEILDCTPEELIEAEELTPADAKVSA